LEFAVAHSRPGGVIGPQQVLAAQQDDREPADNED
jgi:hypothetical protein